MPSMFRARWRVFRQNKRAFYSLVCFVFLFFISIFAEFIANDKPLFIYKDSKMYFPVFVNYPETAFGGDFETWSDYLDSYVRDELLKDAFVIYAPIPYSYDSIVMDLPTQAPTPPDSKHYLGTDDKAGDVAARLIYGYRISIVFALILSVCSVVIGVSVGALQGYYGGKIDLIGQRLIEMLNAVPIEASLMWILCVVLAFSWMILVNLVRAEFLKARNLEYVRAAKAMGVSDLKIMFVHILPNAMSATLTFTPFIMAGRIVTLSSLDFLGFGMPVGSASLGELLAQGKNNLSSPHLGISAFVALCVLLSILVFIGEGARDALDPHIKPSMQSHIDSKDKNDFRD